MPAVPLEPRTALFLLGMVYLMMAGLVWVVLRRHHDTTASALWCVGGALIGGAYVLYSFRDLVPMLLSAFVANAFALLGTGLRIGALQREQEHGERWKPTLTIIAGTVLISVASGLFSDSARRGTNLVLLTGVVIWLAWQANAVAHGAARRGARLISGSYAFLAASLLLRAVMQVGGWTAGAVFAPTLDLAVVLAGGLAAGIFGNVGYLGISLDAVQARRESEAQELLRAHTQRMAAEAQSQALGERLAARDEFVRVLAHEVRQPLNNASAALQSASSALKADSLADLEGAQERVRRAQKVIGHIVGVIDNTLAATTLLADTEPIAPRDADVNVLVALSLGDLDPTQKSRVQVERGPHARTAAMDIGLMRLALRNLLANALAYSPPGSPVTLHISDSDEPLGLAFEVRDEGGGVPPELLPRLFERGAHGQHATPSHGLGLYVVRQAMLRHRGQASWRPNTPQGSVFRVWLPLGE
jgi:signal transduction histidine kinase